MVLAVFADTYLAHADPNQPNLGDIAQYVFGVDQQRELARQRVAVGTLINLLKEYNDIVER